MKTKLLLTILFSLLLANCKKTTEPKDDGEPITAVGQIRSYVLEEQYYRLNGYYFDENGMHEYNNYILTSEDKEKDKEYFAQWMKYPNTELYYTVEGMLNSKTITVKNIYEYKGEAFSVTKTGYIIEFVTGGSDNKYGIKIEDGSQYYLTSKSIDLTSLNRDTCYDVKGILTLNTIMATNIEKAKNPFSKEYRY